MKVINKAGRARSRDFFYYAALIKGKDGFGTQAKRREGEREFILFKLAKVGSLLLKTIP